MYYAERVKVGDLLVQFSDVRTDGLAIGSALRLRAPLGHDRPNVIPEALRAQRSSA
jgi:hypothetical protein